MESHFRANREILPQEVLASLSQRFEVKHDASLSYNQIQLMAGEELVYSFNLVVIAEELQEVLIQRQNARRTAETRATKDSNVFLLCCEEKKELESLFDLISAHAYEDPLHFYLVSDTLEIASIIDNVASNIATIKELRALRLEVRKSLTLNFD